MSEVIKKQVSELANTVVKYSVQIIDKFPHISDIIKVENDRNSGIQFKFFGGYVTPANNPKLLATVDDIQRISKNDNGDYEYNSRIEFISLKAGNLYVEFGSKGFITIDGKELFGALKDKGYDCCKQKVKEFGDIVEKIIASLTNH